MVGGDAVGGAARVAPFVGELVTKPRRDARREWIAVDVPQHVQDVSLVAVGDRPAVPTTLPKGKSGNESFIPLVDAGGRWRRPAPMNTAPGVGRGRWSGRRLT